MKTTKIYARLFLIAAIALSGCAILYNETYSNYDKSVDFTKYKTYAWLNSHKPHEPTPYENDVIENNAKSYVDHEFKDRGYVIDTVKPDVLMELVLKSEKKTEEVLTSNPYNYTNYTFNNYPYNHRYNDNLYYSNPYYNLYPFYNYSRPYSYYTGYNTVTREYTQSTITINVIDRASNMLVWTGSAEGDIYDPAYLKDEIHPAVDKILKQYPIKPIKKK
jgi:hypothetical protein